MLGFCKEKKMTAKIELNNCYSKLTNISPEVSDFIFKQLRFKQKGYFHSNLYKQKIWDGNVEFFKKKTGKFLTGLLPEILLTLKTLKVNYEIIDHTKSVNFQFKDINEHFLNQFLAKDEKPVILRDYQVDLANAAIKHKRGIICAPTSAGKSQPIDAIVYTPEGPKYMDKVSIGDKVLTPSGIWATVLNIFPQGFIDVYQMNFYNGDAVESSGEHLWKINSNKKNLRNAIRTTLELKDDLDNSDYYISVPEKVDFKEKVVIVNPYLFGYTLGANKPNQKIPDEYKYNSYLNRLKLLKGIITSGGFISRSGKICFITKSKVLIKDIRWIVKSLGFVSFEKNKFDYKIISFDLPKDVSLDLVRKNTYRKNSKENINSLLSIEYVGKKECKCILIDHKDHMYITDNFIPTHNTLIMASVIKSLPLRCPTLILANRKSLVEQNYQELKHWGLDVGRVYGGIYDPKTFTCASFQSLHKIEPLLDKIRAIVVDEIHENMSKKPKQYLDKMKSCSVRIAVSATPFKFGGTDSVQKWQVKGYFGPILKSKSAGGSLTIEKLQQRNILSHSDCKFYIIDKPELPYAVYIDAVTYGIAKNTYFHEIVARLVSTLKGRTLILVDRIEHGDVLSSMIKNSLWVQGKDNLDTRNFVINELKKSKENVVAIATQQIFNAGINVMTHNVINAAGGQAEHQIVQRVGRGLRTADDKTILRYYDFLFKNNDYLEDHSKKRIKILKKEGHNVEVKEEIDF